MEKEKVYIFEGVWSFPMGKDGLREFMELMKNPIPAEKATDILYNTIGDDVLYDEISEWEQREGPETDVRGLVCNRVQKMIEEGGFRDDDEYRDDLYNYARACERKFYPGSFNESIKRLKQLAGMTEVTEKTLNENTKDVHNINHWMEKLADAVENSDEDLMYELMHKSDEWLQGSEDTRIQKRLTSAILDMMGNMSYERDMNQDDLTYHERDRQERMDYEDQDAYVQDQSYSPKSLY